MSSSSVEPETAAAIKVQSHVRGHLLRERLKKPPQSPSVDSEKDEKGEIEEPVAARASYTAAATAVRGGEGEVLVSTRSVGGSCPSLPFFPREQQTRVLSFLQNSRTYSTRAPKTLSPQLILYSPPPTIYPILFRLKLQKSTER